MRSGPPRSPWNIAPGRTPTRGLAGAAARLGVGAAPAESPPVLRGPREVCAGQHPANPNHGRVPDPILLAVAHGELALAPRMEPDPMPLAITARMPICVLID